MTLCNKCVGQKKKQTDHETITTAAPNTFKGQCSKLARNTRERVKKRIIKAKATELISTFLVPNLDHHPKTQKKLGLCKKIYTAIYHEIYFCNI